MTVKINRPPPLIRTTLPARAQLSRALVSLACVVGLALAPPLSGSLLHVRRNLGDLEISWKFLGPLARCQIFGGARKWNGPRLQPSERDRLGRTKFEISCTNNLTLFRRKRHRGISAPLSTATAKLYLYSVESGKVLLGLSRDGQIVYRAGWPAAMRDECAFMQRIDLL